MQYNFFALLSRMKYITRWGLMKNTMPENLQEHTLIVALFAHALAVIRRDVFGGSIDPNVCAAAALFHDVSEILTGDMPTPIKYFGPDIQRPYRRVEELAEDLLLSKLPEGLQASYRPLLKCRDEDPEVYAIVKAADKLSAYVKCVEELKSGNREFEKASEQILAALRQNPLPELAYFMAHFLDGYFLTLDELCPFEPPSG